MMEYRYDTPNNCDQMLHYKKCLTAMSTFRKNLRHLRQTVHRRYLIIYIQVFLNSLRKKVQMAILPTVKMVSNLVHPKSIQGLNLSINPFEKEAKQTVNKAIGAIIASKKTVKKKWLKASRKK